METTTRCSAKRKWNYNGILIIDTIICRWYCISQCAEYEVFERKRKKAKMVSRAELLQICKELGISSEGLSIAKLRIVIRKEADRKFIKEKKKVGADDLSDTLKKFLTLEADWVIRDREGKELDWQGREVKKRRKKRSKKDS